MKAAIVDDNEREMQNLQKLLLEYGKAKGLDFDVVTFDEGLHFLNSYTPGFQIVFLDIEMACSNGIKVAEKLRSLDKNVCIVFVTNFVQYAVEGYSVDAIDYLVKPLAYPSFSSHMDRILTIVEKRATGFINVVSGSRILRVAVSDIFYVEVLNHALVYHTSDGDLKAWGSLKEVEEELKGCRFARCNKCYLVNLSHVQRVDGDICLVHGDSLLMSRGKKKGFLELLVSNA